MRILLAATAFLTLTACDRIENVGRAPDMSYLQDENAYYAMSSAALPDEARLKGPTDHASLWNGGRTSLLGDRRAERKGDILTVVIEIDDKAEISNSSDRSRSSSGSMGIPEFFGIPQRLDAELPEGASMANAVSTNSSSGSSGDGSVRRNEKLTLRIAATVIHVMPNGALQIEGRQEVRVNFELRELLVSGFVRPEDVSRMNEVNYDKIASARISYGGRGQITDMQQPRYGQQIADIILPF